MVWAGNSQIEVVVGTSVAEEPSAVHHSYCISAAHLASGNTLQHFVHIVDGESASVSALVRLDFHIPAPAAACSLGLIMDGEQRCMALGLRFVEDGLDLVYALVWSSGSTVRNQMELVLPCCIGCRIVRQGLGGDALVLLLGGSSMLRTFAQSSRGRRIRPPRELLSKAQCKRVFWC